ncbi:trigger factor [Mycoplasma elephantis]|uniref:trigger factor n=1 Tax=Mycoplasma elephantis TaxID=114882 RepID=UPI0004830D3D|nr:trigger factor [Mycoplasma elephantis]
MIKLNKKTNTATILIAANEEKWTSTINKVEEFLKNVKHEVKDVKTEVWEPAAQIYLQENADDLIKKYEKENKIILIETENFKIQKVSNSELEVLLSFIYYDENTKLKLEYKSELEKVNPLFVRLGAENEMKQILAKHTKEIPVSRKAENGDYMTFDFIGKIDGKPFEHGSSNDYELQLGSKQFIESLESQLVGLKTGDKVDLDVIFPNEYHAKELAGKKTVFSINVKKIVTKEQQELNDKFVESLNIGLKTVKELEDRLNEKHTLLMELELKNQFLQHCLLEIYENNKIKLSEDLINYVKEQSKNNIISKLEADNKTLDDYYKATNRTEKELEEQLTKNATETVALKTIELILYKQLKIKVTKESASHILKFLSIQYNKSIDEIKEIISEEKINSFAMHNTLIDKLIKGEK